MASAVPVAPHPDCVPLFAEARGDIAVSFEFFPPKTEKMADTLWESLKTLEPLGPRFVSVTYGAGGSTRERTHATVARIVTRNRHSRPPRTSPASARAAPRSTPIARDYWERWRAPHRRACAAIRPRWAPSFEPHPKAIATPPSWSPASSRWRRSRFPSPAYPECHPEIAERSRRHRQSQAQDRRRRRPRHHPILLRSPNASSLSRPGCGGRASTSRSCPASCR